MSNITKKNNSDAEISIIPYYKTNAEGVIQAPACKLCNAECRKEAEEFYEQTPNYRALVQWLKTYHNLEISYPAVRNHIIYHYKAYQKYDYLEGYAEDIKKWVSMPNERIPALKKRRAILERELINLGADTDSLKGDEKRKNIELMRKLADSLLVYDTKIDDIYRKFEPVTMVLTQLNIIMSDISTKTTVTETKEAFDEVLNRLEVAVGDILNQED